MSAPTGSIFDTHSTRIEEVINRSLGEFLPMLHPVWENTLSTSIGVGSQSDMGRHFYINKVYFGSLTGVIEGAWNSAYDNFVLFGDKSAYTSYGSKVYTNKPAAVFPDPFNGPNAKPYRLTIPMRAMVASLGVTMGMAQAEATPAFIGQVLGPYLRGFARNWAHTLCMYWHLSQASSYSLSSITSVSSVTTSCTFIPGNLAIDRFATGMRLDIYDSTGTTRRNEVAGNRKQVIVGAVDPLEGVVTLNFESDASGWGIINTDILVFPNSKGSSGFLGIAGINSWLKTGGSTPDDYLLGAEAVGGGPGGADDGKIAVDTHPEFKSFHKAVSGVLTEHLLRQYIRRFHAAKYMYGQYIDTLIASDGVWMAYEGQKIGREWIDRTNRLSSVNTEGSQEGFSFSFEGRTYQGYTCNYVESGTLYGIRRGGNNWKKYIPPDPSGVQKMAGMDDFVPFRFVANALAGHGSNRLPYLVGNRYTEGSEMPGILRMQLVPEQPAMLKLTSLTEDRVYSTAQ